MKEYTFELEMKVRDYECDIQGIVNNSNYQCYMEHTRHEFLLSEGVSFADLHNQGIDAVVARVDIQFKASLRPGDVFISKLSMTKEGLRLVFLQRIYRKEDMKLCTKGRVETVIVKDGELTRGELFDELFDLQ